MDYPANLKFPADQAVFTSVRSPMGEGYRLIAAGPAVTHAERMEITQRCPSHAALCDDAPDAVGLVSFPLSTGRHCVGYTCYAGIEQTGRGGYRVYTHLAVLSSENFAAADFDPVAVHGAIARAIGESRILNPVSRLEPFELRIAHPLFATSVPIDHACFILAGLFANRRVVAGDLTSPLDTLRCLICALPACYRKTLFVTAGIKFALNRHAQLTFINRDHNEAKRFLRGQNIDWIDPNTPLPQTNPRPGGWLDYVQTCLSRGTLQPLADLTRKMTPALLLTDLDRIAALCFDIEKVPAADPPTLQRLIIKYVGFKPANDLDTARIADFRAAAKSRSAALQKSEQSESENTPITAK